MNPANYNPPRDGEILLDRQMNAASFERTILLLSNVAPLVTHLLKKQVEHKAKIVSALGRQLEIEFWRGFSEKSLRHMLRFVEALPDFEIVSARLRQSSWTYLQTRRQPTGRRGKQ